MSGAYTYLESLHASETVAIDGGAIVVTAVSYTEANRPLQVSAGPFSLCATVEEAIALGDALIRMAHHYTAAMAEYQASLGEQAVES